MSKHEFFVEMTCEGCSGAVTRVLNKLDDVKFDIDLPNKKVFIEYKQVSAAWMKESGTDLHTGKSSAHHAERKQTPGTGEDPGDPRHAAFKAVYLLNLKPYVSLCGVV
ncbi:hypothetical protein COCON_G00046520 [Conger conger]|uniref:Copper transport protein ATOX1 n=1 Tax=Conger conger TaxID=82655 RepID=A0A9Q1I578_CONCO|nr:hypothetical protein COCON_G00046520 [Conger conger]